MKFSILQSIRQRMTRLGPLLLLLTTATATLPCGAKTIRLGLKKPDHKAMSEWEAAAYAKRADLRSISIDSLPAAEADSLRKEIVFVGYDKTLNARTESFFISSHAPSDLQGLEIELRYFTMDGEQLHERTERLNITVPSGRTVKADIPSWDTQKSFFYHLSTPPRKHGIPYQVRIQLNKVWLPKE